MKRRRQVDRQDRVPFLDRELIKRRDILDARIIDEHVERPQIRLGRVHGGAW